MKTLSDITRTLVPRVDQGTPDRPPAWLGAIMKRFPARHGETFEEHWRRTHSGQPARPPADAPRPTLQQPSTGPSKRRRG